MTSGRRPKLAITRPPARSRPATRKRAELSCIGHGHEGTSWSSGARENNLTIWGSPRQD